VCSLDPLQTRARVWSCAPRPAAGQPGRMRWSGGRTGHNGTSQARRPRSAVRQGGHPYEPDGGHRQGGGGQSGAAGETPPAKRFFADGQGNNSRQKRTVNRPAEVAMGRKSSYTAKPDGNAARHTDARSLAIPVPRGTMIPTTTPPGAALFDAASSHPSISDIRDRLRRSIARVYASERRLRTFFQRLSDNARPVPKPGNPTTTRHWRLIHGIAGDPAGRGHGKIGRVTCENWDGRGRQLEISTVWRLPEPTRDGSGCFAAACSIERRRKNDGNLGMFGKPRKFLLPAAVPPSQTRIFR